MKKLANVLSPDIFRILCVIYAICMSGLPFLTPVMTPYLKLFHVYAAAVILADLLGERRLLRNRGRGVLVLFVMCYAVTLLQNTELITVTGISDFCYVLIQLSVVYSYSTAGRRIRMIGNHIICWLLTFLSIVSLWMFFEKIHIYIESANRYIGIYLFENRLSGIFSSPAVLGMVSLIGIMLSALLFTQLRDKHIKWLYLLPMFLHFCTMLLANARAANYAFMLFCIVLTFCVMLKKIKGAKGVALALCIACVAGFVSQGACRLVQYQLSYADQLYTWLKTPGVVVEATTTAALSESTTSLPAATTSDIQVLESEITEAVTIHSEITTSTAFETTDVSSEVVTSSDPATETNAETVLTSQDTAITSTVTTAETTTEFENTEASETVATSNTSTTSESATTSVSDSTSSAVATSNTTTASEAVTVSPPATTSATVTTVESATVSETTVATSAVTVTTTTATIAPSTSSTSSVETEASQTTTAQVTKNDFSFGGVTVKRNEEAGLNGRLTMWLTGLKLVKQRPLFGYGLNNYDSAFAKTGEYVDLYDGGFHNTYLDILVGYGFAGLLCLFLFLLLILIQVIRFFRYGSGHRQGEVAVLVAVVFAYLLYALAESTPMFVMNHTGIMFWYFMTQLVVAVEEENAHSGHNPPELLWLWCEKVMGYVKRMCKRDTVLKDTSAPEDHV